jgi:predicted Zn-dependent peptidase
MLKSLISAILILGLSWAGAGWGSPAGPSGTLEERVHERILDNGLRVVAVERHAAPVFFALISFRVGSNQELPNHSGLSHFLEHMLFKGTKTVGTLDYRKEQPLMEELERTAAKMRDIQIMLQEWRFDLFEEFTTRVKAELPEDVRARVGSDEAAGWRAVLENLPVDTAGLPTEWAAHPWTLIDRDHNYWALYRELMELRVKIADLIVQQRKFINQAEFDGIYDSHGAQVTNAFTSNDQTTYLVGLPSNCLELWMFLESDRFQNPVFREFYSEREVVTEELHMDENEPDWLMFEGLQKAAYDAHPYQRPIIGWLSDIRLTLRSDMENHFRTYYAPNNCQITVVGDVDAERVFQMAQEYFGRWKPAKLAEDVTVTEPEQNGERRVAVEFDAEPRMLMAFHAPVAPHPDYYALYMLDYILSSGKTSRFYRKIFEEQGLTAGPPWSSGPNARYPEVFTIGATPKAPHTVEEVEAAILAELERFKSEPVSQLELERARNNFRAWQLGRLRSNQWLAFTLSSAFVNRGDWRTVDEDFQRVMAVTAGEIQQVAQKYFTARNRTIVTMVKPAETAAQTTTETGGGQ